MMRIMPLDGVKKEEILSRSTPLSDVSGAVAAILAEVKARGDAALFDLTKKFDGVTLDALEVTRAEIDAARAAVDPDFLRILEKAAANIRKYHEKQVRRGFTVDDEPGVLLGQRIRPVDVAGIYVPGGTAAYPSTVLMDAIPAKIAGCPLVVMVTPPGKDGKVPPAILAAASVAGVDRVFRVGGAQAVAALAYGTETIPKADKIVGPGNAFVAEAKKQVFGVVSIDMIAGPSEILIVSDEKSDPAWLAADLLSQAEHDKNASAVLVTNSLSLAKAVQAEVERQLALLPREPIARVSIEQNGKIIVTPDVETAVDIANELAPEHLELAVDDPLALFERVRHAGSVFLGRHCPEALGDYLAGPNHTLPTGGTARFSSPLSVDDFIKKTQYICYDRAALDRVADDVARFAETEGLSGHARSALARKERP